MIFSRRKKAPQTPGEGQQKGHEGMLRGEDTPEMSPMGGCGLVVQSRTWGEGGVGKAHSEQKAETSVRKGTLR